jgi:transcriptional regulator with XRE-family HTH domain
MSNGTPSPRSSASIGAVIRRSRAGRFTLAQLAQRAGVSSGLLSLIERGQGNPSLETLRRIAGALDVELVELLVAADGVTAAGAGGAHVADGSIVAADRAIVPADGAAQDVLGLDPGAGWHTSMILGRGQEARLRVLDGSIEVRLREVGDPLQPTGVRPPIAVDIEVRTTSGQEPVLVEIPPVSDPRWLELVNGSIPFEPTALAARMLFTHVTRCIDHDPSSPNVDRWVSELRGYFVKYESVSKPELQRIFG